MTRRSLFPLRGLCVALAALVAAAPSAWAAPSQLPLLTRDGAQGKANLVFTFDDSGSMNWSYMPDDLRNTVTSREPVMHPRDSLPLRSDGLRRCIVRSDVDAPAADIRLRSPQINTIYYNPEVRYVPWSNASGQSFNPLSNTAAQAYIDPLAIVSPTNTTITQRVDLRSAVNNTNPDILGTNAGTGSNGWCNSNPAAPGYTARATGDWLRFRPAIYYVLTPGRDGWARSDFTPVDLTDVNVVLPLKAAGRTDCVAEVARCTRNEELQNFANWFTYYRSRHLTAKGAVSRAFGAQNENLRLGYGRINKASSSIDGGSGTATLERGVRDFSGADRQAFFNWLYTAPTADGTPLRRAMDDIGRYFQRADNAGPWGNTPGSDDGAAQLECRKSYHLLMTDGKWNAPVNLAPALTPGAKLNNDGTDGPTHVSADGASYTYSAVAPYKDGYSNTLADVASYYWKNDLRPDLPNRVKPDLSNPAFWQNLVQYTVGFGVGGTLSSPADLDRIKTGALAWPQAVGDTATAVDDLWHAAVNSRGEYLSARDPEDFTQSLTTILADIANRQSSEAGVATASRSLQAGNRKYIPRYKTKLWTGDLEAWALDANGAAVGSEPVWSAGARLPSASARNIVVWKSSASKAVAFDYATLSAQGLLAEMALTGTAAQQEAMINYLRGDTSVAGPGYRTRTGRLGDIVNSPPTYVKNLLDLQYNFLPDGTPGKGDYKAFLQAKANRSTGVVYVGANDGMLHAFKDNGAQGDASNGTELFAYIPRAVLPNLSLLAAPSYGHRFYVDGPLVETDAYFGGAWKNVLMGSTGAGGRAVFALDVTNPNALSGDKVLWEFNSSNDSELGYVMGSPDAGLMADGQWAAVFGNGVESSSGKAQLFVVNLQTGALIRRIDTSVGGGNGLGGVTLIKNSENMVIGAYAGDLKGNLWRFDMKDPSPANWKVGFNTAGVGKPLITVKSTSNTVQPIVAEPQYLEHPKGGTMVIFGTGKFIDQADSVDLSAQSLYGVWDTTPLDEASVAGSEVTNLNLLVTQTVTGNVTGASGETFFTATTNSVDWATKRGWRLALNQAAGQRSTYGSQWVDEYVLFGTFAPTSSAANLNACDEADGRGFNYLINPLTGASPTQRVLDTNGDGSLTDADAVVAGYRSNADGRDAVLIGNGDGGASRFSIVDTDGPILGGGGARPLQRVWRQIVSTP